VRPILLDTWNYLRCTTTGDSKDPSIVDLFALNSYSWCNGDNFQTSTYDVLTSNFAHTNVPVFFSEYGCNRVTPRTFDEVQALYSTPMSNSMSGGLVYEYTQAVNNYGLVNVSSDGSVQLLKDFENLQAQYNKLNYTLLEGLKSTNGSISPPKCEASLITNKGFETNFTMPVPPPGISAVIQNGLTNPNQGKLVTVSTLTVSQTVRKSDGSVLSGLAIKVVPDDQFNTASGTSDATSASGTTSSTTGTSTSAAPAATTSKSAAVRSSFVAPTSLLGLIGAAFWLC
jgi:hypothetical protein